MTDVGSSNSNGTTNNQNLLNAKRQKTDDFKNKIYLVIATVVVLTQAANLAYLQRIENNANISKTTQSAAAMKNEFQIKQPVNSHNGKVIPTTSSSIPSDKAQPEEDAVFYNIYCHKEKVGRTKIIIKEQLSRIKNTSFKNVPVYYTLIGHKLDKKDLCLPGLDCRLIQHKEDGNEIDTLEALHNYCQDHPNARVAYIHDKGSFHTAQMANHVKRKVATNATISETCRFMPRDKCNVCSTHMVGLPHWHTNANMWTADCNYVRKLISPRWYGTVRKAMFDEIHTAEPNHPHYCLRPPVENNYTGYNQELGLGRFAMESWIFTHPDVKPCDVFLKRWYDYMVVGELPPWEATLHVGPYNPLRHHAQSKSFSKTWQRVDGRLYELERLYGKVPDTSSFFWQYYSKSKALGSKDGCTPAYRHPGNILMKG